MSDANPFDKPVEASIVEAYEAPPAGAPGPIKIPASLMTIAIVGLLIGLLGVVGVCAGGVGLAMSQALVDLMPDEDAKKAMRELFDLQFIPSVIQLVLSMIISPLLLASSIGCLTRKLWSQGLMKISLLGSILSTILGLGVNVWMTLFHWDVVNAPNASQPGGETITMIGQVMGIGYLSLILLFLVWALIAMGGKTISGFYDRIEAVGR